MAERLNYGTMGFNNQQYGDYEKLQQMPAYTAPPPKYNEGIETLVNTYSPPTDIQAQAAEQRTRASQVNTPAQNLANQQANAFNQLLVNAGVIAPPEGTDPPPDEDDDVTDPPPDEDDNVTVPIDWWEPFGYANEQEAIASGLFEFNSDLGIWIMTPPEFVGTSNNESQNNNTVINEDVQEIIDSINLENLGGTFIPQIPNFTDFPYSTVDQFTKTDPTNNVADTISTQTLDPLVVDNVTTMLPQFENELNLLDPTILDAITTIQQQQPVQALDVPALQEQLNPTVLDALATAQMQPAGLETLVPQNSMPVFDTQISNSMPVFDTQIPTTFAARDPMLNTRER
jgi:hypothetical protein